MTGAEHHRRAGNPAATDDFLDADHPPLARTAVLGRFAFLSVRDGVDTRPTAQAEERRHRAALRAAATG
jgi:hypothetical protein